MPRPTATPAIEGLIEQVIRDNFNKEYKLPAAGDQFTDHYSAFQRVQQFAFANGFAVVEAQVKSNRRVFSCVHYGKSANKRNLESNAVPVEVFEELGGIDESSKILRLRQAKVSTIGPNVKK
ncbi:hypothetical protein RUND412_008537 [Rhizina undulata]